MSGEQPAYIPLPHSLADPRAAGAAVFDSIAALYEQARPGYPPEAVADLRCGCGLPNNARILEIGCGTGQLTRDLVSGGEAICALEPGAALAEIARGKLASYPTVEVITAPFEDFEGVPSSYDLVVSATAFHWIDPDVGYSKAASLLKPGGWLALVTNTHAFGGTHTADPFSAAVRESHRALAPETGDWSYPSAEQIQQAANGGGDIAAVWARVERKVADSPNVQALFEAPIVKTYPWIATYSRNGYLDMLASQSSYALMERERRGEILDSIGRLVDLHLGGAVTKEYVCVVALAERTS